MLMMRYPQLLKEFKEQIYAYDDEIKVFMEENLRKIDYIEGLDIDAFHEVLFNFKQETFEGGVEVAKEKEVVKSMYIVKNGVLEVRVKVDQIDICIERLFRGSILNHRAFLVGDVSDVKARCFQNMTVFSMTYDQMKKLSNKNAKLDREIQQVKDSVKGINNPYYIDYILCKSVIEQSYAN